MKINCARCVKKLKSQTKIAEVAMKDLKSEFKRKLSGEPVNWKEYAFYQIHAFVEAEVRERETNEESRYFMELEKAMHENMELTDEQVDAIGELYIQWATDNDKI